MREVTLLKKPLFWLALLGVVAATAVFSWPDQKLHLVFCDVGQGDATLITYQTTQVLVDGGPDDKVLNCLSEHMPFWDRQIEMIVLTHPEADHYLGLIDVIKRYGVKQFVINPAPSEASSFQEFQRAVVEEKAPVYAPKQGDRLKVGPVQLAVLWPKLADSASVLGAQAQTQAQTDVNESAIVLGLAFGNFNALLTADIDFGVEKRLALNQVEVLKVAHHGSKYSTGQSFLEAVKPQLAVISVGRNNYGHPTKEVIERLQSLGIKFLRTDQSGEVEVVSDGESWYTQGQ